MSAEPAATVERVPWSAAIPPGVGHVRRGFVGPAIKFFAAEAVWIAVLVGRRDAVVECFRLDAADRVVAAAALVALPFLLAIWARFDLDALLHPPSKRAGASQWRLAVERLSKNGRAKAGTWCLAVLYLVALLRPVLAPYDPNRLPRDAAVNQLRAPFTTILVFGQEGGNEIYTTSYELDGDDVTLHRDPKRPELDKTVALGKLGTPKRGWSLPGATTTTIGGRTVPFREEYHLLGTDEQGRDLLSRMIYGAGISLWIGFLAMALAVVIGTFVGAVAGYFGGGVDMTLMRLVDVLLAFPLLLLLLVIATLIRAPSIWVVVAVLGATGWMGVSRLVRGEFLKLKELDFTTAARALGVSPRRVIFRHLLPNAMAPVIVQGTLIVGGTILTEAALSFLGYGVQPPDPSWGTIIFGGSDVLHDAWWIATVPGLAIVFTVVSFNLVGDALRDALDPRLKV